MPASPALLVTAAAVTLALLAVTGPAPNAGPRPARLHVALESRPAAAAPADSGSRAGVSTGVSAGLSTGADDAPALRPAVRTAPVAGTTLTEPLTEILSNAGRPEPSTAAQGAYRPPVEPAVVLTLFDSPEHPWGRGHRGVDLEASGGDQVHAPADGVVVFAGTVVDRGVITLLHPDGLRSSLEPVDAGVGVGTKVAAGEVVGTVQDVTHCPAEQCVHWGVRRGETYLDPLGLLPGSGPIVLLPVG